MEQEKHACIKCGSDSKDRLLLSCEQDGKPVWVCSRCLPVFVHGPHHSGSCHGDKHHAD